MTLKDKYPRLYKEPWYDIVAFPNTPFGRQQYTKVINGVHLRPNDYYLVMWDHEIWKYLLDNQRIEEEYYQRLDGTTNWIYVYRKDIDQVIQDFKEDVEKENKKYE